MRATSARSPLASAASSPARQLDEVICPYLLRRNLLIPAHLGPMELGLYQAR